MDVPSHPARHVYAEGHWEGMNTSPLCEVEVEETSSLAGTALTRHIHSQLGKNEIVIRMLLRTPVLNQPHIMLLYHFNFGFPLLEEQTEIVSQKAV